MLKKSTSWSVLIYGLILIILGIYGYYQAGSQMSLYVGSGMGLLVCLGAVAMFAKQGWAFGFSLFLTILLTAMFAYRYSTTTKAIPAILSVVSGGMLLFLLAQAGTWRK
ncbi:MAG TPA: TMEM14 family protein [Chlamydiales bacterium]|nr:TMEM14 family protein [Chlamydiales bacterium]